MKDKEKRQIWEVILPPILSLAVVFLIFGGYLFEKSHIVKHDLSDFKVETYGNDNCVGEIEMFKKGKTFVHVKGYFIPDNPVKNVYNYGLNLENKGFYIHNSLALVNCDYVYVLPTTEILRVELFPLKLNLNYIDTEQYNFYVGVESKFPAHPINKGDYDIAVISWGEDKSGTLHKLPGMRVTI
jgi:hypothetical protein